MQDKKIYPETVNELQPGLKEESPGLKGESTGDSKDEEVSSANH